MTETEQVRVTVEEAGVLQSYPPIAHLNDLTRGVQQYPETFIWDAPMLDDDGNQITNKAGVVKLVPKTKQYLIIGNACPPLLVERVLEELWSTPADDLRLAA